MFESSKRRCWWPIVAWILIAWPCSAQAQSTVLWLEDFELGLPMDWSVSSGAWEVGVPTVGPSAFSGDQCAATNLDGNYPYLTNSRVITHEFVVPPADQNPRLRFRQWYSTYNTSDYGQVQIRPSGGGWQLLAGTYAIYGGSWTHNSVDLSAFEGQSVEIGFLFVAQNTISGPDEASGWYVDDVSVEIGTYTMAALEDFELGMGDWSATHGQWQVGDPSVGPSAHSGDQCAGTMIHGIYAYDETSHLVSPTFVVPDAFDNPRLRFWQWYRTYNTSDYGDVRIRAPGGGWTTIAATYTVVSGGWTRTSVDLSAYAGQTVQLGFRFVAQNTISGPDEHSGWYIDDVTIETGPYTMADFEDFELGLGDWSASHGQWQVGVPTAGPSSAHSGDQCAGTIIGGNYAFDESSYLVSPTLIVPDAADNPRLRFWHWYRTYNTSDYGEVRVKPLGGSWELVAGSYTVVSGGWTRNSVDLSAYAGQTVQLGFRFVAQNTISGPDENSGWYIDDVTIETGPYTLADFEDFELGLGDWSASHGQWQVGVPTAGPSGAYSGDQCAGTIIGGNYAFDESSYLVSPTLVVPDATDNPRLRFWHWYRTYNTSDYGEVRVKPAGGSWELVASSYTVVSGGWTRNSVDLSAYAGQTVQLGFRFVAQNTISGPDEHSGWYIDDVTIETGPFTMADFEDFELGLGDWSASHGQWQVGVPTAGPSAYSGDQCAGTIIGGNYAFDESSYLVSPYLEVPDAADNPRMRFRHWYSTYDSSDYGEVRVKPVGGSWTNVPNAYSFYSGGWTHCAVDLSDYAGQTVQIGFLFVAQNTISGADENTGWYVDDVSIVTGPYTMSNPEGFDAGMGDWWASAGQWQVGAPTTGPGSAYSGVACAATVLHSNYAYNESSYLVGAPFEVPDAALLPELRFQHWYQTFNSSDYGQVRVLPAGGTWEVVSSTYSGSSGGWFQESIDLTAYGGQTVQLGFLFVAQNTQSGPDEAPGWYIDDIQVFVEQNFVRGDANGDMSVNIADAVKILDYLFLAGSTSCRDALDVNGDGTIAIGDPIYLSSYLFLAGPPPPAPFPDCGMDTDVDPLGCSQSYCP